MANSPSKKKKKLMASSNYTHEHPNQNATLECTAKYIYKKNYKKYAVAGDRTRVTRVTGGNTYHYTTTTLLVTDGRDR